MKIRRVLSYIFGSIMLFLGIILVFSKEVENILGGVSFIFISILIYPVFNYICKLCNKGFSVGRKITLGIITFLLTSYFIGENANYTNILSYIFITVSLWVAMFVLDKKSYIEIENKYDRKFNKLNNLNAESKKNKETNIFNRLSDYIDGKRSAKLQEIIEYENKIKENFYDLDIMTINAMAKMLCEVKEKHSSAINIDMPEINISELTMAFCKDSQEIEDEFELNNLYTNRYYMDKINKYCWNLSNYIKKKIKETLPPQSRGKSLEFYFKYLSILLESMGTFVGMKFYRIISINGQNYNSDRLFERDSIDYRFKDSLKYMVDALATCTCIAKMIFVEKKVKNLNENDDFYKIISNMASEIKDVDVIIKKSRPIYDEFYKPSLGFIEDELLYGIAITTMVNRMINSQISKSDEVILDISKERITNLAVMDLHMKNWLNEVADKYRYLEIDKYILYKISNTIDKKDFDLFLNALGRTNEYINLYYSEVKHNNKNSDRERYLKGDFEKEKNELSGKYKFNNITTGTQFELYLVNLFKDLGYKTKHNGKSGDQGADLILRKDDYVYVVQAKYYTGKLSNTPVQEITGALKYYNANQGVVVTNSEFTSGAVELAKVNNVILIDGKGLKKLEEYIFEEEHTEDILKNFEK